jgi:multidrug efflux pump
VTAPLEVQFGQMPGPQPDELDQLGRRVGHHAAIRPRPQLDVAEQEVQAAINAAGNLLPSDLPAPPIYAKVNPADAPILTLALTSKTLPLTQVEDLAEVRLAQKISQLPGVGLVSISGGQRRRCASRSIRARWRPTAQHRRSAHDIGNANVNTPKGNFDGPSRPHDQRQRPAAERRDYADLVIAYKNGAPVRLSDVATVVKGREHQARRLGQHDPGVILNVQRQPGANVIAVVDSIKALLPQLNKTLPPAVDVPC